MVLFFPVCSLYATIHNACYFFQIVKLLKKTIAQQKSDKKQRLEMFGGMLQGVEESSEEQEGGGTGRKKAPPSLYADKKDVPKFSTKDHHKESGSVVDVIKENWGFVMSVVLLVLALVVKYAFL